MWYVSRMNELLPASARIRDDIDPATTWVVSDTHFGHENIVGYCHRPEDHEQVMLAEWRKAVPDDATVLHLGDLCFKGNAFFKHIVAKELTGGLKLLIKGNHDRNTRKFYQQAGFKLARPFSINYAGYRVSFSHYPWEEGEDGPMQEFDVRLHGHIHNNGYSRDAYVPFLKGHINLSLEQTRYTPVNLKLLLDAALLGEYPETTQEQLDEAARRKRASQAGEDPDAG